MAASLLFATMSVCVKLASEYYSTAELVMYRSIIGAVMMGAKLVFPGPRLHPDDLLDLIAAGASREEILKDYPFLEPDDITAALTYAARQTARVAWYAGHYAAGRRILALAIRVDQLAIQRRGGIARHRTWSLSGKYSSGRRDDQLQPVTQLHRRIPAELPGDGLGQDGVGSIGTEVREAGEVVHGLPPSKPWIAPSSASTARSTTSGSARSR